MTQKEKQDKFQKRVPVFQDYSIDDIEPPLSPFLKEMVTDVIYYPSKETYSSEMKDMPFRNYKSKPFDISPSGNLFANLADDENVQIWDGEKSEQVAYLNEHKYSVKCITFSFDGKYLAVAENERAIRIYETTSWEVTTILYFTGKYLLTPTCMKWSPDGEYILVCAHYGEFIIWDKSGVEVKRLGSSKFYNFTWTPDGKYLLGLTRKSNKYFVQIFHHKSWRSKGKYPLEMEYTRLACSSDSSMLALGSIDGAIKIIDIKKGTQLYSFACNENRRTGYKNEIMGLLFVANDTKLVSNSARGYIRIDSLTESKGVIYETRVPLANLRPYKETFLVQYYRRPYLTNWALDPEPIILNKVEEAIKTQKWDFVAQIIENLDPLIYDELLIKIQTLMEKMASAKQNRQEIQELQQMVVEKRSFFVKENNFMDFEKYCIEKHLKLNSESSLWKRVSSLAYNSQATLCAAGSADKKIRVWDTLTDNLIVTLDTSSEALNSICFSPDSKLLVSESATGCLTGWDTKTWSVEKKLKTDFPNSLYPIKYSPDGSWLVFASERSRDEDKLKARFRVIDAESWEEKFQLSIPRRPRANFECFDISPQGDYLACGNEDGLLIIYETKTWKIVFKRTFHASLIWQVLFSPDGKYLLSCGRSNNRLMLHDTKTWQVIKVFKLSGKYIQGAFSHDSKRLAACSRDRTIRLWDLTTAHFMLMAQYRMESDVTALTTHPTKEIFLVADLDGNMVEWSFFPEEIVATKIHELILANQFELVFKILEPFQLISFGGILTKLNQDFPNYDEKLKKTKDFQKYEAIIKNKMTFLSESTGLFRSRQLLLPSDVFAVKVSPKQKWIAAKGNTRIIIIDNQTKSLVTELESESGFLSYDFSSDDKWFAASFRVTNYWPKNWESDHFNVWNTQTWKKLPIVNESEENEDYIPTSERKRTAYLKFVPNNECLLLQDYDKKTNCRFVPIRQESSICKEPHVYRPIANSDNFPYTFTVSSRGLMINGYKNGTLSIEDSNFHELTHFNLNKETINQVNLLQDEQLLFVRTSNKLYLIDTHDWKIQRTFEDDQYVQKAILILEKELLVKQINGKIFVENFETQEEICYDFEVNSFELMTDSILAVRQGTISLLPLQPQQEYSVEIREKVKMNQWNQAQMIILKLRLINDYSTLRKLLLEFRELKTIQESDEGKAILDALAVSLLDSVFSTERLNLLNETIRLSVSVIKKSTVLDCLFYLWEFHWPGFMDKFMYDYKRNYRDTYESIQDAWHTLLAAVFKGDYAKQHQWEKFYPYVDNLRTYADAKFSTFLLTLFDQIYPEGEMPESALNIKNFLERYSDMHRDVTQVKDSLPYIAESYSLPRVESPHLCRISPTKTYGAFTSNYSSIRVFDFQRKKPLARLFGHIDKIQSIVFTGDDKYIVSTGKDNFVLAYDTSTWKIAKKIVNTRAVQVSCSPDGRFLAIYNHETLVVRLFGSWEVVHESTTCGDIYDAGFTPDSRSLLLFQDEKFMAYSVKSWEPTKYELPVDRRLYEHAISASGTYLVCGTNEGELLIWQQNSENEYVFQEKVKLLNSSFSCIAIDENRHEVVVSPPSLTIYNFKTKKRTMLAGNDYYFLISENNSWVAVSYHYFYHIKKNFMETYLAAFEKERADFEWEKASKRLEYLKQCEMESLIKKLEEEWHMIPLDDRRSAEIAPYWDSLFSEKIMELLEKGKINAAIDLCEKLGVSNNKGMQGALAEHWKRISYDTCIKDENFEFFIKYILDYQRDMIRTENWGEVNSIMSVFRHYEKVKLFPIFKKDWDKYPAGIKDSYEAKKYWFFTALPMLDELAIEESKLIEAGELAKTMHIFDRNSEMRTEELWEKISGKDKISPDIMGLWDWFIFPRLKETIAQQDWMISIKYLEEMVKLQNSHVIARIEQYWATLDAEVIKKGKLFQEMLEKAFDLQLDLEKLPATISTGLETGFKLPYTAYSLAVTSDENLIAFGTSDGSIRLCERETVKVIRNLSATFGNTITALLFSADEKHLIAGALDGKLRIWNLIDHTKPAKIINAHTTSIRSLMYTPDGQYLISASLDGEILYLNPETWNPTKKFHTGVKIYSTSISPDGRYLAISTGYWETSRVLLWDFPSETLLREYKLPKCNRSCVAFSLDGESLITGINAGKKSVLQIWNVESKECTLTLDNHTGGIYVVLVEPNTGHIISGSNDRTVRIWNQATGEEISCYHHTSEIRQIVLEPEKFIASDRRGHVLIRALPRDI